MCTQDTSYRDCLYAMIADVCLAGRDLAEYFVSAADECHMLQQCNTDSNR